MSNTSTTPRDYVGQPLDGLVFVIVGDRMKFNAIELPLSISKNGCHSKTVGDFSRGTTTVVFQWWPEHSPAVGHRPSDHQPIDQPAPPSNS